MRLVPACVVALLVAGCSDDRPASRPEAGAAKPQDPKAAFAFPKHASDRVLDNVNLFRDDKGGLTLAFTSQFPAGTRLVALVGVTDAGLSADPYQDFADDRGNYYLGPFFMPNGSPVPGGQEISLQLVVRFYDGWQSEKVTAVTGSNGEKLPPTWLTPAPPSFGREKVMGFVIATKTKTPVAMKGDVPSRKPNLGSPNLFIRDKVLAALGEPKPHWKSINVYETNKTSYAAQIVYDRVPGGMVEATADELALVKGVLAQLLSQGRKPTEEWISVHARAYQAKKGVTGASLWVPLGSTHYDFNKDAIEWEPPKLD